MVPLLRPTKIRYYVNTMTAKGFSAAAVLAGSGITQKRLADPALLVDSRQCEVVIKNMIRLTDNSALGFEIGRNVRLTDFGILAHAMMSSRTLGQAVHLWVRYFNLVGMTIQLEVKENRQNWSATWNTLGLSDPVRHFCVEETLMHAITLGEALTGVGIVMQECAFAYPPPAHAALYRELLDCPIHFNAPVTKSVTRSPLLNTPLRGNDPEFNEICLRHCSQILRQISSGSPIVAQLRSLFLGRPGDIPSLTEAANRLGISARSLRRRLLEEGTSYQAIMDEFRLDLAREYFKSEHLTPKEIGFLLGFRNSSSFFRAFKSWTGKTIQQYRDEM